MKKFMTDIKTLAALLMAGAAFTACSSSDDNIIEQPQNPTEPQVYTMVIKASKGGDATTRALKPGTDSETGKNTVDAYWSGYETIEVYQSGEKIGTATAAPSADGNTTVTATLTSAPVPSNDLNFYLGGYNNVYTGQNGLLTGANSISEKYDYVSGLIYSNAYTVNGLNVIPGENSTLTFDAAQQAIIKFTLKDKANDAAISPSALTVTDGTSTVSLTSIPATTYTANGAGVLYVAFPATGGAETITLTATVGSDTYTYTTSSAKTFVNGQYYEITVKMTKQEVHIVNSTTGAAVEKVNGTYSLAGGESYTMSGIGSGDISGNNVTLTIEDGTVLTGDMLTPYDDENNASIVLNGDFTLNGEFSNHLASGSDKDFYDAGYATITSGDGNNHTLNVNGGLSSAHIHLAEHVTLRLNGTSLPSSYVYLPSSYGYVKNADGSADITPSEETIGSVTYYVYEGSGTVGGGNGGGVVTVWFNSYIAYIDDIDGSYVVFNNDATTHVTLTDTGTTGEYNDAPYKCYTAPLTAGAVTYTVYDSSNNAMTSSVYVSGGDIYISWYEGDDNWGYKNW